MKSSKSWKTFFVISTGKRCRAHEELLRKFISMGHLEVTKAEDCDYYLVFCPITSRVGSDINEAQSKIPGDKSAVLIVMHHTYNKDYIFVESKRLVDKPNIVLTVDVLFHQEKLLVCPRNDRAWDTILTCIWGKQLNWKKLVYFIPVSLLGISVVLLIIFTTLVLTHVISKP